MGLIKTAMMTGGGIYAVKQLAKTAERRHDNQNSNNNNNRGYPSDNGYQNQGYSGPPYPPPRPYYQDQRQWSDYNQGNDERSPPTGGGYGLGDYNDQKRYQNEDEYQYRQRDRMAGNPPSYYPQQQQQGYAMASQDQDGNRAGPSSGLGGLADMAMEFAGNGKGQGKNRKKMDKGTQMVSEFFGK